ncbi:TIGR02680 family protein, partial [Streptomyces anthocyanicus]
ARRDAFAVQEERLRTQEATLEAPLQEILQQITDAEEQLTTAQKAYDRAKKDAEEHRDRLLKADHALEFGRTALATAVAEQVRTTLTLEPYARPDLLGLLEANAETIWLPHDMWPSPEHAVQALMDSLTSPGIPLTGIEAAQSVVPASVASLVNALDEATRGRPITSSLLKTV